MDIPMFREPMHVKQLSQIFRRKSLNPVLQRVIKFDLVKTIRNRESVLPFPTVDQRAWQKPDDVALVKNHSLEDLAAQRFEVLGSLEVDQTRDFCPNQGIPLPTKEHFRVVEISLNRVENHPGIVQVWETVPLLGETSGSADFCQREFRVEVFVRQVDKVCASLFDLFPTD